MDENDEIYDALSDLNPDAYIADGFKDAYIGHTALSPARQPVAVYDAVKCIEVLMRDGASRIEALEYFEFNVVGAYVGNNTPIFVWVRDVE